jgi:hypothetical protein
MDEDDIIYKPNSRLSTSKSRKSLVTASSYDIPIGIEKPLSPIAVTQTFIEYQQPPAAVVSYINPAVAHDYDEIDWFFFFFFN